MSNEQAKLEYAVIGVIAIAILFAIIAQDIWQMLFAMALMGFAACVACVYLYRTQTPVQRCWTVIDPNTTPPESMVVEACSELEAIGMVSKMVHGMYAESAE